jgi:hypothetical protein
MARLARDRCSDRSTFDVIYEGISRLLAWTLIAFIVMLLAREEAPETARAVV